MFTGESRLEKCRLEFCIQIGIPEWEQGPRSRTGQRPIYCKVISHFLSYLGWGQKICPVHHPTLIKEGSRLIWKGRHPRSRGLLKGTIICNRLNWIGPIFHYQTLIIALTKLSHSSPVQFQLSIYTFTLSTKLWIALNSPRPFEIELKNLLS